MHLPIKSFFRWFLIPCLLQLVVADGVAQSEKTPSLNASLEAKAANYEKMLQGQVAKGQLSQEKVAPMVDAFRKEMQIIQTQGKPPPKQVAPVDKFVGKPGGKPGDKPGDKPVDKFASIAASKTGGQPPQTIA